MSFVHLHVHTEYSLLDGMSKIPALLERAAELGMPALAITDHGCMYGVIEFYQEARRIGIKPIIGMEAYLAPRNMCDRDPQMDSRAYHLLLLSQNMTGYQNLLQIASAAQLEGFYYRPRIDKAFLAAHAEGIIVTSGCMASEIPHLLTEGREREAREAIGWYQDVFGPDNFFLELQDHDIPELHGLNRTLVELAPQFDAPLVATNDVHYIHAEDADSHDVLLCIGTSSLVTEGERLRMSDGSYYLRPPEEMRAAFAEVPEAIANTLRIAEACHLDLGLDERRYHLPRFTVPEEYNAQTYLRYLCEQGLVQRYSSRAESPEIRERLEYELRTISSMGFDEYFLIVWDLCEFARSRDIWWNVRGSGAGSLVAYVLGITNIDPLENHLLFERFLNPHRVNMPDIDLDYPDDRRAEMIEYCVHQYGEDRVAQIITFGTMGARAAIRDVGRTLDVPLNEVDRVARLIPNIPSKPVTISEALEQISELRDIYDTTPYIRDLIDTAQKLEGVARHASTHAAGVIIADRPLVEYLPLHRPTKGASDEGALGVVSQWSMDDIDTIGLLKVDFLGLRTLTILREACRLIEQYQGVCYTLEDIPYHHNPKHPELDESLDEAFKLLARGDTAGVFQVEGGGMTGTLIEMQPTRFEHIVAAISLFRPGPMEYIPVYIRRMHGEEPITYHHPRLEPILAETYGIIVYQEQIMQIASDLFGYSLGEADLMRRAVSKKKKKDLQQHRARFLRNGPEYGISREVAARIFGDIEYFAHYGFNKSHAADYAMLTVQTAYLKAHYPHEYMTALLTVECHDTGRVGHYVAECRRMEIDVLPPNLNLSDSCFTIEDRPDGRRAIRFGLTAVKNVGEASVQAIVTARPPGKPFRSLSDFCQRVDLRQVGRRALECLIKVGVFDEFGPRHHLLQSIDRLMSLSNSLHRALDTGQMSLFGDTTGVQLDSDEVLVDGGAEGGPSQREMTQWEKELIGTYVSEHPLMGIIEQIRRVVTAYSTNLTEEDHDRQVTMVGVVESVRPHVTKNGKQMAFAQVEDLYGAIEVVIWPSTWDETKELWQVDRTLLLRGRVDASRGEPKLLCEDAATQIEIVEPVDTLEAAWAADGPPQPPPVTDFEPPQPAILAEPEVAYGNLSALRKVWITFQRTDDAARDIRQLHRVYGLLTSYPGQDQFALILVDAAKRIVVEFPNATTGYCATLCDQLTLVLGEGTVRVTELQGA